MGEAGGAQGSDHETRGQGRRGTPKREGCLRIEDVNENVNQVVPMADVRVVGCQAGLWLFGQEKVACWVPLGSCTLQGPS